MSMLLYRSDRDPQSHKSVRMYETGKRVKNKNCLH
jgi:hypothetical protein